MTGAYLRAKRGDKWENIEVEHLTPEELREKFLRRSPEELVNWMDMLCGKIREVEPLLDDLVAAGILGYTGPEKRVAETKE
jgi:hypothetical protein